MTHYWRPCHSLCHSSPLTHHVFQPHGDVSNPVTGNFFNLKSNGSLVSLDISMMHCTLYINCCTLYIMVHWTNIAHSTSHFEQVTWPRAADPTRSTFMTQLLNRNRPSPPAGGMSSRKRDALGRSIRHKYLFVCSFIYLFFNKGLKQIDGQSLLQGRKRRICRDDCFIHHRQVCTWANWIFFFFCLHMCACVHAKKTRGWFFFFATCAVVCGQ